MTNKITTTSFEFINWLECIWIPYEVVHARLECTCSRSLRIRKVPATSKLLKLNVSHHNDDYTIINLYTITEGVGLRLRWTHLNIENDRILLTSIFQWENWKMQVLNTWLKDFPQTKNVKSTAHSIFEQMDFHDRLLIWIPSLCKSIHARCTFDFNPRLAMHMGRSSMSCSC